MNLSQVAAEENLIALQDLVRARGRATIPEIAQALGWKRSTTKDRVRLAVQIGILEQSAEQAWDDRNGLPGPAPYFFKAVQPPGSSA